MTDNVTAPIHQVTLKLLNVTSTLHNVNNAHELELDNCLSYMTDGYFYSPMYRRGMWDGKKHLYKVATKAHPYGKFPTGLTSRVLKTLAEYFPNTVVDVEDLRSRPPQQHPLMTPGFNLHDYEQQTVNTAIERTRGLFRLPTGAGKSVIEAAIIARLNLPTLVMSHRQEILFHLKRVAERLMGFEIGILGAGEKKLMRFNVATVQTIQSCFRYATSNKQSAKVVEFLQNQCQCLIVDEAHHSSSDSYLLLANRAYGAFYRFGFSATPYKNTAADMLVEAGFGKLQVNITPSDLIRQKRLSKPYIFFVDYGDTSRSKDTVDECHSCHSTSLTPIKRPIGKPKKSVEDADNASIDFDIYQTCYKCNACGKEWTVYSDAIVNCLVKNDKRNEAIVQLAARRIQKNRSVLILVNYIQHGQELENRLKQLVDPEHVQFVQGATEDKKGFLDQLAKKTRLCLIATTVFGEGVDIPSLSTLIYARASGSSIDVIQGVGRALRIDGSKRKTLIIDFSDKSDYLKSRAKFRYDLLKEEPEFVVRKLKLPSRYQV